MEACGLTNTFLGLLQNLLCIPVQQTAGSRGFLLLCRLVRHVALNKDKLGEDPEGALGTLFTSVEASSKMGALLESIDSEASQVPLNKKLLDMQLEIEKYQKKVRGLEIELKEREEQLQMIKHSSLPGFGPGMGTAIPIGSASQPPSSLGETLPSAPPPPPSIDVPPSPDLIPPPLDEGFPPPPPGVPPPPGAPPPGAVGAIKKKKPRKIPKEKLKGLQWSKLALNKIPGTIFEKFPETFKQFDIDYADLERTFTQKETVKKDSTKEKKLEVKTVHLLDHKVGQNLCK